MQDLKGYTEDFFSFWKELLASGHGEIAVAGVLIVLLIPVWISSLGVLRERVRRGPERLRAETEQEVTRVALNPDNKEHGDRAERVLALLRNRPTPELAPPPDPDSAEEPENGVQGEEDGGTSEGEPDGES